MHTLEVSSFVDRLPRLAASLDPLLEFTAPWLAGRAAVRLYRGAERLQSHQDRRVLNGFRFPSAAAVDDLEWQDTKTRIILTLERFPDAFEAVRQLFDTDDTQ